MPAQEVFDEGQVIHDHFTVRRNPDPWFADLTYAPGAYVSYQSKIWLAAQASTGQRPITPSPFWTEDSGLIDPSAITVGLTLPNGAVIVYTLISAGTVLVRDGVGRYHVDFDTTGNPSIAATSTSPQVDWLWEWYSVGTGQTALTRTAEVKPSPIPLPYSPASPTSGRRAAIIEQVITSGMIVAGTPVQVATPFIASTAIGSVYQGMNVNNLISVSGSAYVTIAMNDGVNPSPFNASDVVVLTVVQ